MSELKETFEKALTAPVKERGFELKPEALKAEATFGTNGAMKHGAVVIAAITSCTNTSNPSVLLAAGLVAKKAVEKGLTVQPYVKTSLAPGSRVVASYLERAGLLDALLAAQPEANCDEAFTRLRDQLRPIITDVLEEVVLGVVGHRVLDDLPRDLID